LLPLAKVTTIVTWVAPRGTVPFRLRNAMSVPEIVVSLPIRSRARTVPPASANSARTWVMFAVGPVP
jgi:hypothetical protein